jgi:membrane protein YqaA with SNARE-associated domain
MASHAVFAIYSTRASVESALMALKDASFRNSDISILAPDNLGDFHDVATVKSSKAPEGTAAGATTGALIGGVLGWVVGIGSLAIPGLGPLIAAGPIMAALAGVGVGGAVGGVTGALIGFGVPEFEAKRYEGRVKTGGILLSVHADSNDWADRAKKILKATGGDDISVVGEHRAA